MEILKTKANSRMNTSFGQPVPIRFYIQPLMESNGNLSREKFINFFKTEYYG